MTLSDDDRKAFVWMRSRPPKVQEATRKFPPVCRVTATRPLGTPAPGHVGRVISYVAKPDGSVNIRVVDEMDYLFDSVRPIAAECEQRWITVLQYDGNKTPEWIDRVLAGEDVLATNPGLEGKIEGELPGGEN